MASEKRYRNTSASSAAARSSRNRRGVRLSSLAAVTRSEMPERRNQLFYTLLGYVSIAAIMVVIGAVIAAAGLWAVNHHVDYDSLVKWGGLTVNTVALFGWVIKQSRQFWRKKAFWWTMAGLLSVHLAGFWVILINVEHWRLFWFFVICTLEVIPISATLDGAMDRFGRAHRR